MIIDILKENNKNILSYESENDQLDLKLFQSVKT